MKRMLFFSVLAILMIAMVPVESFATESIGDTLVVGGVGSDDDPLNVVIAGDTTEDGGRKHNVYRLLRDGWYELSGSLNSPDFDLNIVAEDGDGRKPVLVMGLNEEGGPSGWQFLNAGGGLTMKNIWVQQIHTSEYPRYAWSHAFMFSNGPGARIILDGCIFDFNDGAFIMNEAAGQSNQVYKFTDCMWRWNGHWDGGAWCGFGMILKNNVQDSVVYENCTFLGGVAPIFTFETGECKYFKMNHCTVVDHAQFLMRYEFWTNAEITNNLFFNAHFAGENATQLDGQAFDGLPYGVVTVDSIPADSAFMSFPAEEERKLVMTNNCNFVDPDIKAWWSQAANDYADVGWAYADPSFYDGFLNTRAQAMFADDDTWPGLELADIYSEDPSFTNYVDNSDILIQWGQAYQDTNVARPDGFNADPDGNPLMPTEPDYYDLSYSNTTLMSGGSDGFPVGDLNWFPEKKTEWENSTTAIDDEADMQLAEDFELSQNYPNPFNPTTTINYKISKADDIKLSVYNVMGEEIKTLVNENKAAGKYDVIWNATDNRGNRVASGLYFYKLQSSSQTIVKKMMFLK